MLSVNLFKVSTIVKSNLNWRVKYFFIYNRKLGSEVRSRKYSDY